MKKNIILIILISLFVLTVLTAWFVNSYRITKISSNNTGVSCMAMTPGCGYCPSVSFAGYCIESKK